MIRRGGKRLKVAFVRKKTFRERSLGIRSIRDGFERAETLRLVYLVFFFLKNKDKKLV